MYRQYERYRPWLRDEFVFRCVYCLKREQWGTIRRTYDIDHFRPQTLRPELALDYDNLLYACASCNSAKGQASTPDPCECMLDGDVIVREDGSIEARTAPARKLIRVLGLDAPDYREYRNLWIGIVQMANPELFTELLKYPDELPDLAALRPRSNSRPEGVANSHRARRDRHELPETY